MKKQTRKPRQRKELDSVCQLVHELRTELRNEKKGRPKLVNLGWKRFFLLLAMNHRQNERGSINVGDVKAFMGIGKTATAHKYFNRLIEEGYLIPFTGLTYKKRVYSSPRATVSPSFLILADRMLSAPLRRTMAQAAEDEPIGQKAPEQPTTQAASPDQSPKTNSRASLIFEEIQDTRQ